LPGRTGRPQVGYSHFSGDTPENSSENQGERRFRVRWHSKSACPQPNPAQKTKKRGIDHQAKEAEQDF